MPEEIEIRAMEYAAAKVVEWCIEAVKEHKPESDPDRTWTAAYCEQCAKRFYGNFRDEYLAADKGLQEQMDLIARDILYEKETPCPKK